MKELYHNKTKNHIYSTPGIIINDKSYKGDHEQDDYVFEAICASFK